MAARKLRRWQAEALKRFQEDTSKDFLAVATPGAGKTTFALSAAVLLLKEKKVAQVVVVVPTEHLKQQWADAAHQFGIPLDPEWKNTSQLSPGYLGICVTYAQVAADPARHKAGVEAKPTLVILDEVHHAGDSLSWGDAVREAYTGAVRRLLLSGSPWRSDVNPIPFVTYTVEPAGRTSSASYTYGYGDALQEGVVRPVFFLSYSGQSRWKGKDRQEVEANLDTEADQRTTSRAWRTALDPRGEWIPEILAAADERLTEVRRGVPDAGGLVLATDQTNARRYAKMLEAISGEEVTLVLSDEPNASDEIERYAVGTNRWMVAVRMVSEGVDVPRLMVGVYATNASTALFFTQAVGRFVRSRTRGETATMFLPAVPALSRLAGQIETERRHVLGEGLSEQQLWSRAGQTETGVDLEDEEAFEVISASAHLDRVIYQGGEYGPEADGRERAEGTLLTLPGILAEDEMHDLLSERSRGVVEVPLHRRMREVRRELAALVSAHSTQSGLKHSQVHTWLREVCGGPTVGEATLEELQERLRYLRYGPRRVEIPQQGPVQDTLW